MLTMNESTVSSSSSSTTSSVSNYISVLPDQSKPKVSINKRGNRLYLDYGRGAIDWLYIESDVEIGLSMDRKISYISIELKSKIAKEDVEFLKEAVKNEGANSSSED